MHLHGSELVLSATDLSNFLACRHRTGLDMAVAYGARTRPHQDDPLLDLLWQRGLDHETAYVETLRSRTDSVVDLGHLDDPIERVAATLEAMHRGADVIVQAGLSDAGWFGKPDIMQRVPRASRLGDWSYEIADTKLSRETRAGTILQLGLYSEMLGDAQGVRPERFYVVTPDPEAPVHAFRVDDYAAYFRLVRARMLETVARGHEAIIAAHYPDPVDHCEICRWIADCRARRRGDDHLSLVAGITRLQRRELESQSVATLTGLAGLSVPLQFTPKRGSIETFVRVREQARVQHASRDRTPPVHELLAIEPEKGLCRLPEPSPGDLFLDLEGDLFVGEGGREYLFGVAHTDGRYESAWAFTDGDERRGFEQIIDLIVEQVRAHPDMHVYHYAPYEPAAFKRLMGRYVTRERELDAMLRAGRFVDLYAVVRQAIRAGVERYSIKSLEPLYAFQRGVPLADANRSLKQMEYALELGNPTLVSSEVRATVEGYNRDDCLSTLHLRDWLERVRADVESSGTIVPRPVLADGDAPAEVDDRARRVEQLRAELLARVPDDRADRTAQQHARWLLAYLLDYHRREDKSAWWEYFKLCDLLEEDLIDERAAVAGLEFVERVHVVTNKRTGKPTGSVVDRYRYPEQEMEIERGDVWLQDRKRFGKVVAVDRSARTIDVSKGRDRADVHPPAMFAFTHVSPRAMEDALLRLAERLLTDGGLLCADALLTPSTPRLRAGAFEPRSGEDAVDFAVRIADQLDGTVLPIQGPPGAGKTFCGARMICELIRRGKRVGVTANSHSVIDNLFEEVGEQAATAGIVVRMAHKIGEDDDPASIPGVVSVTDNAQAAAALASGEIDVLGATAWLWSRAELAHAVDVLFIDEAGQMSLANALAVSHAADSLVLLGDPQQLEQPRKGTHPDGVGISALEHLLGEHRTIPETRGIFLGTTWRLAPRICEFTSELFYDNRLASRPELAAQRLDGDHGLLDAGLVLIDVDHDGNRNVSHEEIDVVAAIVARLTGGVRWIDAKGEPRPIGGSDVLVVAPYNAQVNRLADRLGPSGVRVGTVDKFQGQEAPVVIYSMATSRPEDAPRGMEFLYSLNRLNVATSRARCLAILVASTHLFEPECSSPRQMKLANGLCRFRELAHVLSL
jgi:uncharacterized protein